MLATWFIKKSERIFLHAGLAAVTWAFLYLLINYPVVPVELVKVLRFFMYLFIAVSIYNLANFVALYSGAPIQRSHKWKIMIVMALGPTAYALSFGDLQEYVDKLWIGSVFFVVMPAFYSFIRHMKTNPGVSNLILGSVLILGFLGTFHDFRFIGHQFIVEADRLATLSDLLGTPMLVSYIVVPLIFIFSSSRLLQDYEMSLLKIQRNNVELQAALERKELQLKIVHLEEIQKKRREVAEMERTAIHRDLHDGIGSRLVATVYALKSGQFTRNKLEDSLVRCLRDIKKIMSSESEQELKSIQSLLFEFCLDMEEILESTDIRLSYEIPADREFVLLGKRSIEVMNMVQELISNAIKHSHATKISLTFKLTDDVLIVELLESEFNKKKVSFSQEHLRNQSSNVGLKSLQIRSENIGAEFVQTSDETNRRSVIVLRMFFDGFPYLPDPFPVGREERRMLLDSEINNLT